MGKGCLIPFSDFIAKNQLAREGSQSVSPVTIPALTTIVDRQFKEDRTLCPVQALRYYLDRTKDLRGSRSLLFISFKKEHTSDIRLATLSSWLKQTILLKCYKQADQQAKLKCMTLGPSRPLRIYYFWFLAYCRPSPLTGLCKRDSDWHFKIFILAINSNLRKNFDYFFQSQL